MGETLQLRLAYSFLKENDLGDEAEEIRTSKDSIGSYTSTLRRAKIIALLKENNLFERFLNDIWIEGKTPKGQSKITFYEELYNRFYLDYSQKIAEDEEDEDITMGDERTLQNFLVKNIQVIEPGMSLINESYPLKVAEGKNRFIDIYAKDKNAIPTIIELKVSRGHERTIGQVFLYRNLLKKKLNTENIRVIIIANEISPELKIASEGNDFIELYNYEMSFLLKKVNRNKN